MINESYQGAGAGAAVGLEWAKVLGGLGGDRLESGGPNGFNPQDLESVDETAQAQQPGKENPAHENPRQNAWSVLGC